MRWGLLVWLLLLSALLAAAATHGPLWRVPDRHNPWATLRIDEAPGWLTRHKLRRLDRQPNVCLAVLATATLQATPVADSNTGPGCGFSNAVRVRRTSLRLASPFTLSCRGAVSLALWERHVVQPAAARLLSEPLVEMQHFGSYACRNVDRREQGTRSQHATADALDLAAFVLQDGQRITVARDWRSNSPQAKFLHEVHDGACMFFDGVLGPDYNAAHADHLHLDRGPYRICR